MICFCFFCQQKLFFILGVGHNDLFFCKVGPKSKLLEILPHFFFFRTTGLQHKLLILIESPNIFHWKSAKKESGCSLFGAKFGQIRYNVVKKQRNWHFNRVFFIFCMRYTSKSKKQWREYFSIKSRHDANSILCYVSKYNALTFAELFL